MEVEKESLSRKLDNIDVADAAAQNVVNCTSNSLCQSTVGPLVGCQFIHRLDGIVVRASDS